jgi:hypothetical protein
MTPKPFQPLFAAARADLHKLDKIDDSIDDFLRYGMLDPAGSLFSLPVIQAIPSRYHTAIFNDRLSFFVFFPFSTIFARVNLLTVNSFILTFKSRSKTKLSNQTPFPGAFLWHKYC